ncbi:alpha/beta fold hydrolase, partial [Rivihabitans pingtungensis]|uniref:alpha/beta fold hydrolase n=1 Tax=Rivihabitans pingtungensis TaxID=1054498 RepID=UPI002FD98146
MPMHTLADGHSLYYELSGPADADTLVLLNGLTMNTAAWGWHTPLYAGQFQVLTLDLRGQGQSSKPEADAYSLAQQADDVASLLDALGIARAHVLGLSYGGMVAQHLARQHPAKVARLVLASTLAYSDAANAAIAASWEAAQCTGGGDQLFTDMLPWVFGSQFLASQQAMLQAMRAQYPDIRIHLVEGMSGHLGQMLNAREIDLAVLFGAEQARRWSVRHLLDERLFFLCAAQGGPTPLPTTLHAIGELPLVLPTHRHGLRRVIEAARR